MEAQHRFESDQQQNKHRVPAGLEEYIEYNANNEEEK
jgi:hypothetical protein